MKLSFSFRDSPITPMQLWASCPTNRKYCRLLPDPVNGVMVLSGTAKHWLYNCWSMVVFSENIRGGDKALWGFYCMLLAKFIKWTATKAGVSVRRRLLPNDTGINPAATAASTSRRLKSPSGRISTWADSSPLSSWPRKEEECLEVIAFVVL